MGRVEGRLFTLQLSVLLSSGVPILPGLHAMAKSDSPGMSHSADFLAQRLAGGQPLSQAMKSLPDAFDPATVGLVKVGEATGKLHVVLAEASKRDERLLQSAQKLQAALLYPAVVMGVALLMLAFMAGYLLPRFLVVFESFDLEMPLATRLVMGLGHSRPFTWMLLALGVTGLLIPMMGNHPRAVAARSYLLFDSPFLGFYNRTTMLSDLCLDLSLMLTVGLSLTESLALCRVSLKDPRLAEVLRLIQERIKEGQSFLEALASQDRLPGVFVSTIKAGADSGRLPGLLSCLGRLLAEEADFQRDRLTTLLEVAMLAFMGVVVGFILLACFLPIFTVIGSQL